MQPQAFLFSLNTAGCAVFTTIFIITEYIVFLFAGEYIVGARLWVSKSKQNTCSQLFPLHQVRVGSEKIYLPGNSSQNNVFENLKFWFVIAGVWGLPLLVLEFMTMVNFTVFVWRNNPVCLLLLLWYTRV